MTDPRYTQAMLTSFLETMEAAYSPAASVLKQANVAPGLLQRAQQGFQGVGSAVKGGWGQGGLSGAWNAGKQQLKTMAGTAEGSKNLAAMAGTAAGAVGGAGLMGYGAYRGIRG